MGIATIPSEQSLTSILQADLDNARSALWCVAYVDRDAVEILKPKLERLLRSKSRSLRILVKTDDFRTDPDALVTLLDLKKSSPGLLQLSYCNQTAFHAKFYGFKTKRFVVAIVGSANLSRKALGPDSGELGVRLTGSEHAATTWDAAERLWRNGIEITPRWLTSYRSRVEELRKKEKAAARLRAKWIPRNRSLSLPPPTEKEPIWLTTTTDMTDTQSKEYQSALKAAYRNDEVDADFNGGTAYWGRHNKPPIPADALTVSLDFSRKNTLRQIRLIRPLAPVLIQEPKRGRWIWILPSSTIRGSTQRFGINDAKRVDGVLRRHGLNRHTLVSKKDQRLRKGTVLLQLVNELKKIPRERKAR